MTKIEYMQAINDIKKRLDELYEECRNVVREPYDNVPYYLERDMLDAPTPYLRHLFNGQPRGTKDEK